MNDINKLLSGDTQFVKKLIKEVFPVVRSFVLQNSGNAEDAKDLTQESLYILIDKLRNGNYKADTNLSGYCVTIAKNEWMNQIRKAGTRKKYRDSMKHELDIQMPSDNEPYLEWRNELKAHISKLSEPCKNLIQLHYFMKVKLIDVAPLLGYTKNFVKIKHKRCLDQFRANMIKMSKSI